jgi:hypothetical protein
VVPLAAQRRAEFASKNKPLVERLERRQVNNSKFLDEMMKNAKVVQKKFVKPFENEVFQEQGLLPGGPVDDYIHQMEKKFLSFPRRQDTKFSEAFGKKVHEERQKAWKRVQKFNPHYSSKLPNRPILQITGKNYSWDERLLVMEDFNPSTTVFAASRVISLPRVNYRDVELDPWLELLAWSGKLGNVIPDTLRGGELDYKRELILEWSRVYSDEREELRHIYKSFWHAGPCQNNFVYALYEAEDFYGKRVHNYLTSIRSCPDKIRRGYDIVMCQFNGHVYYVDLEIFIDLIFWTRTFSKNRRYAIGEPYSEVLMTLALWSYVQGKSMQEIQEYLTPEIAQEIIDTVIKLSDEMQIKHGLRAESVGRLSGRESDVPSWMYNIYNDIAMPISMPSVRSHWSIRDLLHLERGNLIVPSMFNKIEEIFDTLIRDNKSDSYVSSRVSTRAASLESWEIRQNRLNDLSEGSDSSGEIDQPSRQGIDDNNEDAEEVFSEISEMSGDRYLTEQDILAQFEAAEEEEHYQDITMPEDEEENDPTDVEKALITRYDHIEPYWEKKEQPLLANFERTWGKQRVYSMYIPVVKLNVLRGKKLWDPGGSHGIPRIPFWGELRLRRGT